VHKADLIMRRSDPWGLAAFERRRLVDDPVLGSAWFISPEDLILAKLSWSDGGISERQVRDSASVVRIQSELDWAYIERFADALGIGQLVERIRGDR